MRRADREVKGEVGEVLGGRGGRATRWRREES